MVIQFLPRKTAVILLTAAGVCLVFIASAQVATQNLFRRTQFIEYLRLRNQSGIQMSRLSTGQVMITDHAQSQIVEFNVKCKPDPTQYKIWLTGEMHFAFSRWKDAAHVFSGLINIDSSFCDAYFRLAQSYVAQNDFAAGHNILLLARKRFPDDPLLNLGFGQLYTLLDFPKTALYYFEKQLILHPQDPEGFLGASWAAHELGQDSKAILYLKKGRELLTDQVITATGRLSTIAVGTYTPKNPLGPTLDYLYIFESVLYSRMNQNEKSRDALNHLTNGNEKDIGSFRAYCIGMYYYNKGEKYYNKARRNIRVASATGLYVDAGILRQLGIRSDPTDFKAMVLRENYSRVSTHTRSAKSVLLAKADTLFQNRELNAAAEAYSICIQKDSANLAAFDRLGECYRELGRSDDAVAVYRRANQKFPLEIKFSLLLARELMRAGKTDESILAYQRAIDLDKNNLKAYYGACLAIAHKGEYKKALELWISGKKSLPHYKREGYFLEGILFYQVGLYDIARPALSISSLKKDPISKYYLALSYHFLQSQDDLATSNMLDAIELGAIVSSETVKMVGLDPAVHRSY